jgi:hypothetical protein
MYRIRTAAGTETNYSSLEEFTVAVRRGEVHPEDEIFHTRANRWLDVKSHPHYRSALDGHTPAPAAPTASPAAPSHTQLRPALSASPAPQSPAPRPGHAPSPAAAPQARAQVFERPAAAAPRQVAQTQVHPQLQPQAAARSEAPAPAPYRPAKSKELTFVDTGVAPTVGRPNLPAVELAPPPMQKTELKPAAKPAPIAKSTGNEMDFLIMDGGIESPVRTSAGHKTIPEEFGLLFDQQSVEPQAPDTPTGGKKAAAGARSGKQQAIVIPPDTAAAVSSPAAQPAPAAPAPHAEQATDAPAAAPAPDMTSESTWSTGARTNYLGGGIALLVIVGGLLAWKPWKAGGDDTAPPPIAAQSAEPVTSDPDPSSLITPASASTPPIGSLDGAGAAIPPATRPGTGKEATEVPVDSAKPEVVVAARPDFGGGGVPVSGDISIGTDVGTRGSANAVAPSELVRRLAAAQKDAQLDLNGRLATLGFRGVINPARLGTPALVAAARTAWTGGVDAIRSYRARIARTEKAYEDSVLTSQRSQKWPGDEMRAWAGRQSLAEPSDASQLSDLMFTQVSEGLEILSSMPGDYTIKGDKISFKEAAGATRYASIRGWVEQRMATWASTPESARPYSVSATLRALGDGFPAVE